MRKVAVLFARKNSIYKSLPGCDVWDAGRDARNWPGGAPVVAHPPCRGWGRLRRLAKPAAGELDLARLAVDHVRRWGGVLEHPESSDLWRDMGLARPGQGMDRFGGWTFAAPQRWWGHRAEKRTWFYVIGVQPRSMPPIPFSLTPASHVVTPTRRRRSSLKELSKAGREATPQDLARWLVNLARSSDLHEFDRFGGRTRPATGLTPPEAGEGGGGGGVPAPPLPAIFPTRRPGAERAITSTTGVG